MLQILKSNTTTDPALRPRRVRSHTCITVARARHLPEAERAVLAARWLLGEVTVKSTWEMARQIFRAHAQPIHDAYVELETTGTSEPVIERAWAVIPQEAREAFVQQHLTEIWRLVDRITA